MGGSSIGPVAGTLVEKDLRRRPTGSRIAHPPEIVVAKPLDSLKWDPNRITPDGLSVIVAVMNGDPEPVAIDAEHLRQQLPGHLDGTLLEVVPETEVAKHLEERAVAGRGTDDVDIDRPKAFLDACRPGPRSRLVP